MSLVNNSANNFKDFLDAIKPYLNYQFYDMSGQGVEANNFSTDEKVIGTWIDGKPLYQRTFSNITFETEGDHKWIAVLLSPQDCQNINLIECSSFVLSNNSDPNDMFFGSAVMLTGTTNYGAQEAYQAWYVGRNSTNGIYVRTTRNDTAANSRKVGAITLRYTKTTDTAVASGEKIVGQWIDGKKVYEKTIVDTMPSEVGVDKFIDINTTIETVVSSYAVIHGGSYHPLQLFVYEDTDTSRYFIRTNSASTNPNKIGIRTGHTRFADSTVHITLRYTKTTD